MLYKDNIFLKILTFGPLIFIPAIVGIIYFSSIELYTDSFESNINRLEKELLHDAKQAVKNKVLITSDMVAYQQSMIGKELNSRVKVRVEQAFSIAHNLHEKYHKTKSQDEIKLMIKRALGPLSWNDGESFIWIVDYDGIFQLAPTYLKDLENTSILKFKDATGREIIKEEIHICKTKGEGFLMDTFTKPGGEKGKQYKQIAYVKALGHYEWYLGSSEYLDTAKKIINKKLLSLIAQIDNIDNHYILIVDTGGNIILNKSMPENVGKNYEEIENKEVEKVFTQIHAFVKRGEGYINYRWRNLKTDKVETKISYIKKIPGSDWIIGSGFYLSDIQEELNEKKVHMYDIYYAKSKHIMFIGIVLILASLVASYFMSRRFKKAFIEYELNIRKNEYDLRELNENLENKVQERTKKLKKLNSDYELLARTDSLTKMHNRYSIMEMFSHEINRSNRHKSPLSILFYDIDFFKKINDTYGHKMGDEVLVELSSLVKESLRDIDIIGRYGGEEFLILLPNTKLKEAKIFADRLLKLVDEHEFKNIETMSISIGLAELEEGEDIDKLFTRVDNLLYKSKNDGRNRVSL